MCNWKYILTVCLLLITVAPNSKCANVLGFFPIPSISHQSVFQPIWRELSLRGHNVTVYTTHPLKDRTLVNLTEIDISGCQKIMMAKQKNEYKQYTPFGKFKLVYDYGVVPLGKIVLKLPEVQNLLKDNSSRYDVVLVEPFPTTFLALGYKFSCPVIEVISLDAFIFFYEALGNPIHPILYPENLMSSVGDLNFFERVYNSFQTIKIFLHYKFNLLPSFAEDVKNNFGEGFPYLGEIMRNVSAMFIHVNSVFGIRRPLVPTTIELNYMHIKPRKDVRGDLKKFLDEAKEGVVYVSLGSNVKSAFLPENMLKTFISTFSELPYKILWKWENESLAGVSENVLLRKWLPQQDLLGHPNIKLFVTQGGLQSTEEAIYNKVPTVALPFYGDQPFNAKRMEFLGMGKYLDPFSIDKTKFKSAIMEVIQDPKYRNKVAELSRLSLDQSTTGLERAVWWTEYIIRNKGTKHLRSPYVDVPLYQYLMLDVFGFFILLIYVSYLLLKLLRGYQKGIFVGILLLIISYIIT